MPSMHSPATPTPPVGHRGEPPSSRARPYPFSVSQSCLSLLSSSSSSGRVEQGQSHRRRRVGHAPPPRLDFTRPKLCHLVLHLYQASAGRPASSSARISLTTAVHHWSLTGAPPSHIDLPLPTFLRLIGVRGELPRIPLFLPSPFSLCSSRRRRRNAAAAAVPPLHHRGLLLRKPLPRAQVALGCFGRRPAMPRRRLATRQRNAAATVVPGRAGHGHGVRAGKPSPSSSSSSFSSSLCVTERAKCQLGRVTVATCYCSTAAV